MKTPTIIFLLGLTGLLVADYFNQVRPMVALQAAPNDYPGAKAFIAKAEQATDLTQSPVVERELSIGYLDGVDVNPGFHITHNTALGKEVIVRAPTAAFDYLLLSSKAGKFSPDFDRPVRLKQPVEIELNLHHHGSNLLQIQLSQWYENRSNLRPDFFTEGPLQLKVILINNLPDHDILVDCDKLLLNTFTNVEHLRGKTNFLEIFYRGTKDLYDPEFDAPNLEREVTERTQVFFNF